MVRHLTHLQGATRSNWPAAAKRSRMLARFRASECLSPRVGFHPRVHQFIALPGVQASDCPRLLPVYLPWSAWPEGRLHAAGGRFRGHLATGHGLFDVFGDAADKGPACGGLRLWPRRYELNLPLHVSSGDRPQCQCRVCVGAGARNGFGQQCNPQVFAHEVDSGRGPLRSARRCRHCAMSR